MTPQFSQDAFPGAPVRANDLQYLVDSIKQGHCASVVGVSNSGKSYLLKSLLTPEVRQRCARPDQEPSLMVFVDCLEAAGTEQSFYELLLRRIIEELEKGAVSTATLTSLRALHQEVLRSIGDVAARSLYARSVRQLGLEEGLSLVLILDEFGDTFRDLPPWPFRQLRALFDALHGKLCYVTGAARHLEQLRSGADTYEFRELFHLHTLILRPLTRQDARQFIAYLANKHGVDISQENIAHIVALSGGQPGLLERAFIILNKTLPNLSAPLQITAAELFRMDPIQKECQRLWHEVDAAQDALLNLVKLGIDQLTAQDRRALDAAGLLATNGAQTTTGHSEVPLSPVFTLFVKQMVDEHTLQSETGLRCDAETGQIWLDEKEVTLQLSEPQRKLLMLLYEHAGKVCSYDDVAIAVWGIGEGVSPGAIYELVKRVRQKIEPDWKNPRYIITVSGRGYRLER